VRRVRCAHYRTPASRAAKIDGLRFAGITRFLRVGHAVVVPKIGLAVVPPHHDVRDLPRIGDSQRASQTAQRPSAIHIFKPDLMLYPKRESLEK
jgi:hypothetical protein